MFNRHTMYTHVPYLFLALFIGHLTTLEIQCAVDFNKSMALKPGRINLHTKFLPLREAQWFMNFLRFLYVKNNPSTLSKSRSVRIPKKIHQIWLGPALPPPQFKKWQKTILKHHPTWEYRLWTDKDISKLQFYNRNLYLASANYGERSDILRYEILFQHGGVYLDVDFECIKPLDDLHHVYEFYAGIVPLDCRSTLANGIIGSCPGHPILRECIGSLSRAWENKTVLQHGPLHFEKIFWSVARNSARRVVALPSTFFFPYTVTDKRNKKKPTKSMLQPETYTIHHWTATWNRKSAKVK